MKKLHALLGAVVLSTAATQASADLVYELGGTCNAAHFLCAFSGMGGGEEMVGTVTFVDGAADDGVFTTAEVITASIGSVLLPVAVPWTAGLDTFSGTGDATSLFSFDWLANAVPVPATAHFDSATGSLELSNFPGVNLILNASYTAASAVPVPAAAWLFGSAMLGLVGVSRKRQA